MYMYPAVAMLPPTAQTACRKQRSATPSTASAGKRTYHGLASCERAHDIRFGMVWDELWGIGEKWIETESGFALYEAFCGRRFVWSHSPTRQAIKSVDDVTLFRRGVGKQARPRRIINDLGCSEWDRRHNSGLGDSNLCYLSPGQTNSGQLVFGLYEARSIGRTE